MDLARNAHRKERRRHTAYRLFGYDRGTPIDRYYIEAFLGKHAAGVKVHVLEPQEEDNLFGVRAVTRQDILSLVLAIRSPRLSEGSHTLSRFRMHSSTASNPSRV